MYHMLNRHPHIQMAQPLAPEPKFFLVDELYEKGLAYYSATWFEDIPDGVLAGEKSANYLEQPRVAERIGQSIPKVKLVFILRNPVQRAYSNWLWSRKNGLETEDFETAIALEEDRNKAVSEHLKFARPHAYASRGFYADLLEPFFAALPREQILCLLFEEIEADPEAVAEKTHQFLGLAPHPIDTDGLLDINSVSRDGLEIPEACFRMLNKKFSKPNQQLASILNMDFEPWQEK